MDGNLAKKIKKDKKGKRGNPLAFLSPAKKQKKARHKQNTDAEKGKSMVAFFYFFVGEVRMWQRSGLVPFLVSFLGRPKQRIAARQKRVLKKKYLPDLVFLVQGMEATHFGPLKNYIFWIVVRSKFREACDILSDCVQWKNN